MKILAFDTTAKTAAVSVTEDERLIALSVLNTPNTHSVTLLPSADTLLNGAGIDIDEIDMFVCSAGPGSFTGVRIGVAAVKGLAFSENKPCVGVSALEALAMNLSGFEGIVCSAMDARRGQLYNAIFESDGKEIKRLTPDSAITADELASELSCCEKPIYITGDGYKIAKNALSSLNLVETPELLRYHNAYQVAVLGYRTYMSATEEERACFTHTALSPVYLRPSQAERNLLSLQENEKNKIPKGNKNENCNRL